MKIGFIKNLPIIDWLNKLLNTPDIEKESQELLEQARRLETAKADLIISIANQWIRAELLDRTNSGVN